MKTFGFQWHLTDRCNLRCAHCYQSNFTPESELGIEELKEIYNHLFAGLGGRPVSINLTGGEPFLLPHLLDLIEHLHGFSNLEELSIITNGCEISRDKALRLRSFPMLERIKISLEAGDAAINDAIRGKGNFAEVVTNVSDHWVHARKKLVLMMTLGKHNLRTIEKTVEFARSHGFTGVIFERFVPLGRGRRMTAQCLDPEDWQYVTCSIARAAAMDVVPEDLTSYRAFWLTFSPTGETRLRGAPCNLGEESMALMPDGTVFPCRRLPASLGNICRDPFAQILARLGDHRGADESNSMGCLALDRALGDSS